MIGQEMTEIPYQIKLFYTAKGENNAFSINKFTFYLSNYQSFSTKGAFLSAKFNFKNAQQEPINEKCFRSGKHFSFMHDYKLIGQSFDSCFIG